MSQLLHTARHNFKSKNTCVFIYPEAHSKSHFVMSSLILQRYRLVGELGRNCLKATAVTLAPPPFKARTS